MRAGMGSFSDKMALWRCGDQREDLAYRVNSTLVPVVDSQSDRGKQLPKYEKNPLVFGMKGSLVTDGYHDDAVG